MDLPEQSADSRVDAAMTPAVRRPLVVSRLAR
jgi:hypothetical protein